MYIMYDHIKLFLISIINSYPISIHIIGIMESFRNLNMHNLLNYMNSHSFSNRLMFINFDLHRTFEKGFLLLPSLGGLSTFGLHVFNYN